MSDPLSNYRNLVTLADGTRVLLRPLGKDDRDGLVRFFSLASPADRRFLRDDVADPAVVAGWADNLDYSRVYPLVAVMHDLIVGDATLHFRQGVERHQGELRIYLAREMRRRGLGTRMLQSLIEIGRNTGLHQLIAKVVTDQASVIKALEELGFTRQCTLPNFFMRPNGDTHDLALMLLPLIDHRGEF